MNLFNSQLVDRGSTLLLKSALLLIGIAILGLCGFLLYISIGTDGPGPYRPILLGICVTTIPVFLGLYQAWKLLDYIDNNEAFSDMSVAALKKIKINALIVSALYAAGMPYIYYVAEIDDAPGVILIGLVCVAAPILVSLIAAILQKLLKSAISIKSENDLTV